jgi:hypothetical protein
MEFTAHTIAFDYPVPWEIKVADMDNDGDQDIICGSSENDELAWWENNLNPGFPSPFSLSSPEEGIIIDGFPLWLTWENTIDPDEGDSVRFTVYISPDETFEDILVTECINALSDTSVEVIHLTDSTTYWWKVLAEDLYGNQTWSIETWSFTFIWDDPGDELSSRRSTGEDGLSEIPKEFGIVSTYPNPFNPKLTVIVELPEQSHLELDVININGSVVANLVDRNLQTGCHIFNFRAENLSSGIYFVRAKIPGGKNKIRKVVLIR